MADYSWVSLFAGTTDERVVNDIRDEWDYEHTTDYPEQSITCIEGDASYGMIEDVEALLREREIPYSRYSDGKYEYDGDEAHWHPGMESPRVFPRLNNGGRVFSEADFREFMNRGGGALELGAHIMEWFSFDPAVEVRIEEVSH